MDALFFRRVAKESPTFFELRIIHLPVPAGIDVNQ